MEFSLFLIFHSSQWLNAVYLLSTCFFFYCSRLSTKLNTALLCKTALHDTTSELLWQWDTTCCPQEQLQGQVVRGLLAPAAFSFPTTRPFLQPRGYCCLLLRLCTLWLVCKVMLRGRSCAIFKAVLCLQGQTVGAFTVHSNTTAGD